MNYDAFLIAETQSTYLFIAGTMRRKTTSTFKKYTQI